MEYLFDKMIKIITPCLLILSSNLHEFYLLKQVVPVTNFAFCLNMESVVPLGDAGVLRSYEYLERLSAVYESNHHFMPSTDRANVVSSVRARIPKVPTIQLQDRVLCLYHTKEYAHRYALSYYRAILPSGTYFGLSMSYCGSKI